MKKLFIIIMVLFLFISGCKTESKMQLFETKEQAIHNLIREQSVNGPVLKINLSEDETVLLFQQMKDVYYLGEVTENKTKFASIRTSPGVDIGNTTGAMWEFKTYKGKPYTLKITKEKEDIDSIYNKDFELFITIVAGKRTYEDRNVKNIIKSSELINQ